MVKTTKVNFELISTVIKQVKAALHLSILADITTRTNIRGEYRRERN